MKKIFYSISLILGFLLVSSMTSCHKFEGGQSVPAYIRIDSISVNCDYYTFGANTSKITDAWVYIDDNILGCFELPAVFPVLKEGKHKVSVYGGIMVNGIAATRASYSFYQPCIYSDVNLVKDSVVTLNPVMEYYPISMIKFHWKEDFENGSISLNAMSESDTSVMRVSGPEAFLMPVFSSYSGKIVLPADSLHFYAACFKELDSLPANGNPCLLEMDYNCDAPFTVGLLSCENQQITELPLVTIQPTDTLHEFPQRWNKIYINIGPTCQWYSDASYFKVYFTSHVYLGINSDGSYEEPSIPHHERHYYLDNLKLISR